MIGFFIAILSGACMSVQGVFNSQLTKTTGMWVSNGWVQFTAFVVCITAWIITGRDSISTIFKASPKYILLGGAIGAVITWTVIKSINQLGPAKATLFIIIAQITVSYLIELFGMFGVDKQPFELRKILGLAAAIIGVVIFQWEG